jgi:hypothetical protein
MSAPAVLGAILEYAAQIAPTATDNRNVFESAIIYLPARSHLLAGKTAAPLRYGAFRIRIAETVARRQGF